MLKHGLWILVLLAGSMPAAASEQRSVVMMLGKASGELVRSVQADGSIKVHFEFHDRGRGPATDSVYRVDENELPLQATTRGVDYFKVAVDEEFSRKGRQARWKNRAEDEQRELEVPGFYSSMNGPPEELAMLARALLKSPTRKLALLPLGEAEIRHVEDMKIASGATPHSIGLYAISGLDLLPVYLWLDADLQLFAQFTGWQNLIRAGYESELDQIGKRQQEIQKASALQRAGALTTMLDQPLLIDNVRVFDPAAGEVVAGRSVLVEKGRIVSVQEQGVLDVSANVQRLDGRGRLLMPGLWDMHAHISAGTDPLIDIAAGVTTVRDLANDAEQLSSLIDSIESGRDIGPRVIRAGFIDGRGPYAGPTKVFADTEAEMRKGINDYADAGFVQVKIYSSIKPELVPAAVRFAHERGLRLSGHVPAFMTARQFVEAGADEIQHINFIALNFLYDKVQDTRTPARFTGVAEHLPDVDLGSAEVREFLDLLRQKKTVVDPTLSTFEGMFLGRTNDPSLDYAAILHRLPATWQRGIASGTGGLDVPKGQSMRYRVAYQKLIDLTGMLHRSGVTLVAGTDGTAGFSLVRELELYVAAGIAPRDALRIATLGAAEVMGRADQYGRVAPGYVADLILVDGDPTLLMGDLRKVDIVIRGDRMFDSAALFKSIGLKPWRTP